MSIQSVSNNILDQIQFQSQQAASTKKMHSLFGENGKTQHFSDILFNSINNISQMQTSAKSQAQDYISGASDIGLNDVMLSVQKSSLALNLGVQVRNKLVSAYQDIMSMSV